MKRMHEQTTTRIAGTAAAAIRNAVWKLEQLEGRRLLSGVANAGAMSAVYDDFGTLHGAYYDTVELDLKYVTRDAGGAWSAPVTVDAQPLVGSQLSLALDSFGDVGVAYFDAAHGDLKYASFDGS